MRLDSMHTRNKQKQNESTHKSTRNFSIHSSITSNIALALMRNKGEKERGKINLRSEIDLVAVNAILIILD